MDMFFGYQFTTYGTDVLRISELPIEERVDPMSKVFPKVRGIERVFIYYLMILFRAHERLYIFIFNVCANRLPSVPSINMVHPEPSKTKMVCVYWQQTSLTKRPMSSFGFGKNNIIPYELR